MNICEEWETECFLNFFNPNKMYCIVVARSETEHVHLLYILRSFPWVLSVISTTSLCGAVPHSIPNVINI